MRVGTVKEIKQGENRVGLTPAGAASLAAEGHQVLVEALAGDLSGFPDDDYRRAGATIAASAEQVWRDSDLVVKVKEPLAVEFERLAQGTLLFTYLHLAAAEALTRELLDRKVTAIAYETVELPDGSLPLLNPMSVVAGKMAVQVGAHFLERTYGGFGRLMGGVPGVPPANVVVLGTGIVGVAAATVAAGMGAQVTAIGRNLTQLAHIDEAFHGQVRTVYSTPMNIAECVAASDLLIGAVAVTGARAAKLVTRDMLRRMRPGSVFVDVSIDQGGCAETSRVTTHADPTYVEEGVIHYCVANVPGAVPHTSTLALTNATLPYVQAIAAKRELRDAALRAGVNTFDGRLTNEGVAAALGLPYTPLQELL